MMRSFLWVSVGPMLGRCWAALGLCWASVSWANAGPMLGRFGSMLCGVPWRSLERKIQPQPKTFRLRFILGAIEELCWTNVGPFWVYVGSMLGPCWVIWWAMWGSMEVSGTKKNPTENFSVGGNLGALGGLCRTNVGPFWVYVGSMLGPCWVIWWAMWGSMEVSGTKKYPQPKTFRLGVILGALGGLCRTNVGPFWVYVGSMLGHLAGNVWLHGGLWNEKFNPNRKRFG